MAFLGRAFGARLGQRGLDLIVPEAGLVEVTYRGGMFWHMGGGAALTQTA
jgi:hypothetical protein